MKIVDLHCDTIMRFAGGEHLRGLENSHISLEQLRKGEVLAQCFAIFVPTHQAAARHGIPDDPKAYFDRAYARYREELALCAEELAPALSVAEIGKNAAEGKISAVLTVEDGVTLDGNVENVDDYFEKGVRMVALTWNYENSLGFPQSSDPEKHKRGLKPFGFEAVERMNELGIAVDVSHLSEGGFWDVARVSRKPFIASHSCARALCDVGRNLTNQQLRALAEKGGVCGLNFASMFLHKAVGDPEKDNFTSLEDITRHLRHMKKVAGTDVLALGSDYDGIGSALEWGGCGGSPMLLEALEESFTADEMEKICRKNALRAFRDIWGS